MAGDKEAEVFDQPLLERFQNLSGLLSSEITHIQVTSDEPGSPPADRPLKIEAGRLATIDGLICSTPSPQRVRLAGKLDMIQHSDRHFSLQLESGQKVKGVAETVGQNELATHWGEDVVVHGTASFRPSGTVLLVAADEIEEADASASVWSRMPKPVLHRLDESTLHQKQGPRSGLNAIYGQWPGNETDEEIADALAGIS